MNNNQNIRFLNDNEVYELCKIIIKDERDISVGKVILKYARLEPDLNLFRKIHSLLLESGKYIETDVKDKYGFSRIRYAAKKSWKERYWWLIALVTLAVGFFLDVFKEPLRQRILPKHQQQEQIFQQIKDSSQKQ